MSSLFFFCCLAGGGELPEAHVSGAHCCVQHVACVRAAGISSAAHDCRRGWDQQRYFCCVKVLYRRLYVGNVIEH
jgi:hypothetical protein